MNIEIVGHVAVDHNVSEQASYTSAGSPAMFIHRVLRRFPGISVGITASYGDDYLPYLQAQGVNIYPPKPNVDGSTLVYENTSYPDGTRTQKAYNRDQALPIPIDAKLSSRLRGASLIFIAPILPNFPPSYYKEVAETAYPGAIKILLPQGYLRDFDSSNNVIKRVFAEVDQILPYIDIVIVSEEDGPDMLKIARGWRKRHKVIPIVTLGERGAVLFTSRGEIELPTTPLSAEEIVDSVGSGDIFSAGFGFWLAESDTHGLEGAGRFANALARACLKYSTEDLDRGITDFFTDLSQSRQYKFGIFY